MKDLSIVFDDNNRHLLSTETVECYADGDDGEDVEIEPTIVLHTDKQETIMTLEQAKMLEHDLHDKIRNAREYYLTEVLKTEA